MSSGPIAYNVTSLHTPPGYSHAGAAT